MGGILTRPEFNWTYVGPARQPQTLRHLEAALKAEWRKVPQVRIQCLNRFVPGRCLACVAARGGHIKFWFSQFYFNSCSASHCSSMLYNKVFNIKHKNVHFFKTMRSWQWIHIMQITFLIKQYLHLIQYCVFIDCKITFNKKILRMN